MLANYLATAVRHLFKHKVYTLINISGLASGITSCLLAFLYVYSESRYDVFHQNADNIYRIYEKMKSPRASVSYHAQISNPLGQALKSHNPGLAVARLYETEGWLARNGSVFKEKVLFIDPEFFDIFTFPLARGDYRRAGTPLLRHDPLPPRARGLPLSAARRQLPAHQRGNG